MHKDYAVASSAVHTVVMHSLENDIKPTLVRKFSMVMANLPNIMEFISSAENDELISQERYEDYLRSFAHYESLTYFPELVIRGSAFAMQFSCSH